MSRSTQVIGLNEYAKNLITGEKVEDYRLLGHKIYPSGNAFSVDEIVYKSSVGSAPSGRYFEGMFGEQYPLLTHHLSDGTYVDEYVQAEPWSSGPCIFLALKENKEWIPETLWSDEEINNA